MIRQMWGITMYSASGPAIPITVSPVLCRSPCMTCAFVLIHTNRKKITDRFRTWHISYQMTRCEGHSQSYLLLCLIIDQALVDMDLVLSEEALRAALTASKSLQRNYPVSLEMYPDQYQTHHPLHNRRPSSHQTSTMRPSVPVLWS